MTFDFRRLFAPFVLSIIASAFGFGFGFAASPAFAASPVPSSFQEAATAPEYAQTYYLPAASYYYYPPVYVAPTYVYSTPIGPPVQVWFP